MGEPAVEDLHWAFLVQLIRRKSPVISKSYDIPSLWSYSKGFQSRTEPDATT